MNRDGDDSLAAARRAIEAEQTARRWRHRRFEAVIALIVAALFALGFGVFLLFRSAQPSSPAASSGTARPAPMAVVPGPPSSGPSSTLTAAGRAFAAKVPTVICTGELPLGRIMAMDNNKIDRVNEYNRDMLARVLSMLNAPHPAIADIFNKEQYPVVTFRRWDESIKKPSDDLVMIIPHMLAETQVCPVGTSFPQELQHR